MIAALAAVQHGVVERGQLLARDVSRAAIAYRLRDGRLHPVHAGVYSVGNPELRIEGKWLAAVLACGSGAVLSHRAAAALWGLRPAWRDRIEVSAARTVKGCSGVLVHRPRRLARDERTTHQRVPVTTVSRTLTDVADVVGLAALRKVLEQAEVLRLDATPVVIPGRRGAGRLAAALDDLRPLPSMTRSELEDRFLALCRRARVPRPLVNTTIEGMEVDFCWPAARVIAETDGWAAHGTRAAFGRDRRRSVTLSMLGWIVVRFTYEDVVDDPAYVEATLRRLLLETVGPSRPA
ncbi:MAG: DUF559 domain-containing protein [Solirubrobacteraceae bacterium]